MKVCVRRLNYILNTGTMARKIFTISQKNAIVRYRKLHESKLMTLVEGYNVNLLREAKLINQYQRKLIKEAIVYERAVIVEAMTKMSTDDIIDTYWYMKEAVVKLFKKLGCAASLEQFNSITVHGDETMDYLQRDVDIDDRYKKKITKVFADVMVVVKGLLAIEDAFTSSDLGGIGDILNSVLSQERSRTEVSLLGALQKIDKTAGQEKEKGGMWNKIGAKFSGDKGKGAKFRSELIKVLRSSSPGFMKLIDAEQLADSILKAMPQVIKHHFQYFSNTVTTMIDDATLEQMTKQGGWLSRALGKVSDTWDSIKGAAKQSATNVGRELGKIKIPGSDQPEHSSVRAPVGARY